MPISIKGSGGGSVTLDVGAAAADSTLTLPNTSGTILQSGTAVTVAQGGTGLTSPATAGNVLFTTDGSTWSATQKIVAGTAQASTSGTSIDFTGIPSWVKRITVMFSGVSINGASNLLIQLGISSGVVTTGYAGTAALVGLATANSTMGSGILLTPSQGSATVTQGIVTLCLLNASTNVWVSNGAIGSSDAANIALSGGTKTLSGVLDRVRITTVNGTDTFDAGSINLLWE